jgi:tubulin-specific chaperone A
VNTIHSSGSDLLTLIEDILDLSKVEAGKLEIKPEKVTLIDLCDSMRGYFEPMAKEARLDYHIEIAEGAPKALTTDPTRIKQVLKNLLSNAFKFTNQGAVTLSIFQPNEDSPFRLAKEKASCLCFAVKDTGIGIPDNQIESVFEAFKQLDAKTTRKYGGTGLGLSIVRELVGLLGGEIKMESAQGVGTTVTICVPETLAPVVAKAEPTPFKDSAKERSESRRPSPPLNVLPVVDDRESLKTADSLILIVEDDLRFANSLLDLCRDNGFKGVILNDGVSAVKLAEELLPQGILLDLSLPELDGSDVLRLLKENPKTRHIPIQVITGHDRRNEVMNSGAIGFIKKPARPEELTGVLKKIREYSGKEKVLLIVEDDEAQRRAIREYIEVPGVTVLEAERGSVGLEHLKTQKVDCIILDLKLPDMDGREFLRTSKEICGEAVPPVIIYTGRDLEDAELKELERESKSIIVKSAKSPERLFDETMMFLHRLQKDLPTEKRRIVENLHDPTRILKGKTVLVVDDDSRNILSLTHLLEDHGVRVFEAENGKEALKWLEGGGAADIILMDMMMPEMDGYEATRRIRQNQKLKGIPIVALTARAMKGERERCLEAGCDDYLSKPIENDKLISLLRVWLYRSA